MAGRPTLFAHALGALPTAASGERHEVEHDYGDRETAGGR